MSGSVPGALWAVVLAGGDGRRLQGLTTCADGTVVPKQYCSLRGGPSLLHQALRRAERMVHRQRLCAIVAARHAHWWRRQLRELPRMNRIVQPQNRGTANGVLLSLLCVLQRDPHARIVFLPSDHHVSDEAALARAACVAAARLEPGQVLLLGMEPEEADPELGYIVPGSGDAIGTLPVRRFVEKPPSTLAREFIATGALWNTFIIVADGKALLRLFEARCPDNVARLRGRVFSDRRRTRQALAELYQRLPELDFSRHILQGQEDYLRVMPVPSCGWTDLGTPGRVARALRRDRAVGAVTDRVSWHYRCLSLAAQCRHAQF